MTTEELEQVKDLVLRDLPRVLEQDPKFVVFIEGILSEKFPRRDEFARMLEELESFRRETGQRFGQVDKRFEQVDKRFEQVDKRFDAVIREIRGLKDWMELNVGGFQTKAGRRLEDVVAGAFCYGLQRSDIQPEHVHLRQVVEDTHGIVFRAGKKREIDIIAVGEQIVVFEVKATADHDDIDDLADKTALIRHFHPAKKVQGVLVMLGAETEHRRLCQDKGLILIP